MNERERLVEILKDNQGDSTYYMTDEAVQSVSDVLLDNGVSVPPVKIGQTVYGISRGVIIPISIDKIQYSNRGVDIIGRNERCFGYGTITLRPDNDFGIEWYKTKKQAEKALKGGEQGCHLQER